MWPYCKSKEYDERSAECPGCGRPSTGYFQDGELVMTLVCPDCRGKEPQSILKEEE